MKDIGKGIKGVRTVGALVKGLEVIQRGEQYNVDHNAYYDHMPKNSPEHATLYAMKMGGEDHDMVSLKCSLI